MYRSDDRTPQARNGFEEVAGLVTGSRPKRSNPIGNTFDGRRVQGFVPVEMPCFRMAGASGTRTHSLPKLTKMTSRSFTSLHSLALPCTSFDVRGQHSDLAESMLGLAFTRTVLTPLKCSAIPANPKLANSWQNGFLRSIPKREKAGEPHIYWWILMVGLG